MSFLGNIFGAGAGAAAAPAKKERGRHPANPYILYFQDMRRRYGGNIYAMARECGQRWKNLPWDQKLHYRRLYIQNRAQYGMKAYGGYKKPSQADRWNQWPKVARRTARISKKKQREMAAAAAAAEEAKKKKDAGTQMDDPMTGGAAAGTAPATGQTAAVGTTPAIGQIASAGTAPATGQTAAVVAAPATGQNSAAAAQPAAKTG